MQYPCFIRNYEQPKNTGNKEFYRVESLWRVHGHWRKNRRCYFPHTPVVYLYFFSYAGLSYYCIHGTGLLDEYETIHLDAQEKPVEMALVKSFSVLPSRSFILTCYLDEQVIHERLNTLTTHVGASGSTINYQAGENEFKIVKLLPTKGGYSHITGHALITRESAHTQIHIDYYVADNYAKYFLSICSVFILFAGVFSISKVLSSGFDMANLADVIGCTVLFLFIPFIVRQAYLNSLMTLHNAIVLKLRKT